VVLGIGVTLKSTVLNMSRLDQIRAMIEDHEWDSLLLYGHSWRKEHFRSLVNLNFQGPHAVVSVSRAGDLSILVSDPWDLEAASAISDAHVILNSDVASGLAKGLLNTAGRACAVAGLELMEARFVKAIRERTGQYPISASSEMEELRRVKSAGEIELLKRAAVLADLGYECFVETAAVGMKEYELVAEVEGFLKANGAEDNFMLIASGGREVVGMKPPTERELQRGDSVITELTPQVDGYYAQICRTLVLGTPSAEQKRSFSIFAEAQLAAQDLLKPGVNASDIARAQNDVFRQYGFGEYTGSQYTRVRGHCLGLYLDEDPYILEEVDYVMKKDMVLIAHPNTFLPLAGYMVFGDTLLVTDDGCLSLNRTDKKLFEKEV
jgi:Xaa-Pro aminopeptidase